MLVGMNVGVLGFGVQGRSALEYWGGQGHEVTICDQREDLEIPAGIPTRLGKDHLKNLDEFDLIVRSPIVHPKDIVTANSEVILNKVTTVTNEFFKVCPSKNIIGVTGTKGKGTTSTLITKMLEAAGKRVHLGGNIGTSPLDLLKNNIKPEDFVVLELANFQLIDLKYSPHIAVCLMIAPEHQDWHGDMDEYIQAKKQLFRWQKPEDIAIYYAANNNSEQIARNSHGHKIPYLTQPGAWIENENIIIDEHIICEVKEVKLPGKHNLQNICAAITAAWQITQDVEAIKSVVTSFESLPFRLELRREIKGIKFYNDSFSSAPDSAEAAIMAIAEPKVLLLGGKDRGLDLANLAGTIQAHSDDIRKVILFGASADRMSDSLDKVNFSNYTIASEPDLSVIVRRALDLTKPGDSVLFSPGFPSFDMFKNFEERGLQFNKIVEDL
jgi:UDP-N-acetylmuramoylalanine--D-glutamate ligase